MWSSAKSYGVLLRAGICPSGLLDFVLCALRALSLCDPRNRAVIGHCVSCWLLAVLGLGFFLDLIYSDSCNHKYCNDVMVYLLLNLSHHHYDHQQQHHYHHRQQQHHHQQHQNLTLSGAGVWRLNLGPAGAGETPPLFISTLAVRLPQKWFPTSYLAKTKMFQQKNNQKVVCNRYN